MKDSLERGLSETRIVAHGRSSPMAKKQKTKNKSACRCRHNRNTKNKKGTTNKVKKKLQQTEEVKREIARRFIDGRPIYPVLEGKEN